MLSCGLWVVDSWVCGYEFLRVVLRLCAYVVVWSCEYVWPVLGGTRVSLDLHVIRWMSVDVEMANISWGRTSRLLVYIGLYVCTTPCWHVRHGFGYRIIHWILTHNHSNCEGFGNNGKYFRAKLEGTWESVRICIVSFSSMLHMHAWKCYVYPSFFFPPVLL